jgi:tetratricopeptide (TPR) repeat protein
MAHAQSGLNSLEGRMKEQYMKKVLVTVVLVFAIAASSQQPTQSSQPGQTQPGNTPASQKVIKDPAEYNAYITALNTQDPAAKGAAMEAFVKQYPQSVVLTDALEQAMAGYQQAGNSVKVEDMAKRILQLQPNHIRALAVVVALDRGKATGGDQAALKESCPYAQTGSQQLATWPKPEGMADADFEKLKTQMADIFDGASGFCALQAKNYTDARNFYTKAFQIDPTNLQDVYQLSVADLEMNPIDVNGLWYCSKAIQLAQKMNNAQAVTGMVAYCKAKYKRYHGGEDGWDQIVGGAATQNALPPDFAKSIKPAPTPCELAVQVVQQNDPSTLSFGDKEFILAKANCSPENRGTPENKTAADKVWQSIQDMQKGGEARLKIPEVKVIAADKDTIDAAITDDNKAANKADVHVVMEKPMLHPPAVGATTDIIGVLTKYTPDPFMFTMEHGELPAPKTPPHHTPAGKKKKSQ